MSHTIPVDQLAFIPFPEGLDTDQFNDWSEHLGRADYVDVKGGIVCEKESEEQFTNNIAAAAKWFSDSDD